MPRPTQPQRARSCLGFALAAVHLSSFATITTSTSLATSADSLDYSDVAARGNYSCDDLTRWLGHEKHYSNGFKSEVFSLLDPTLCPRQPMMLLNNVGWNCGGVAGKFARANNIKASSSAVPNAVLFLSNFSVNNNFSHFLHALLRLFCALVDARWIVWDTATSSFLQTVDYTIWLDEYFKLTEAKSVWLSALGKKVQKLDKRLTCTSAKNLVYGSGCVKLLPPEKWFGYPGCRAKSVLPAFGLHYRKFFQARIFHEFKKSEVNMAFTVREATEKTGTRSVSNLDVLQQQLTKHHRLSAVLTNLTFEHLDVASTVRFMAQVDIFVSMHGAGMTNMFFMNPGAAVIEIIPFPLCTCRSPDYFYGIGSYYHGSAVAGGLLHFPYCVPAHDTIWHKKPEGIDGVGDKKPKCSWKHLHAVQSVRLDPDHFISFVHKVERDLVAAGTVRLNRPIINMSPHANG